MKRLTFLSVGVSLFFIMFSIGLAYAQIPAKTKIPQVPITYPGDTDKTIARRAQWIEGAQKEGTLTWWTSASPKEAKEISGEFNKIYPFVKIEYWRGNATERDAKLEQEHTAGRVTVDITGVGDPTHYPRWRKMGIPEKFTDVIPAVEKWDKRTYSKYGDWVTPEHTSMVPMYNTKLVPAAEAPKRWEDLLDPKWKGKIGLTTDMKAWYMLALGEKGWDVEKTEDFLRKLKQQQPIWVAGKSAGHNLLIAGEFSIMAEGYLRYVFDTRKKEAPVDWSRVGAVPVVGAYYMLVKKAPHPNSSRLFYEWFLSPQGLATIDKVTGKGVAFPGTGTRHAKALQGLDLVFRTEEIIVKAADLGLVDRFSKILGVTAAGE